MKKIINIIIMLILTPVAAFAGEKVKVVTSFTIIADMARNVAGDAAEVESITKPGAEIHEYQPTPRDMVKAQKATIILWNGMNLEKWFERFLTDAPSAESFVVSEGVKPEFIDGEKPNPHAWMSPANALIYVENIRKALLQKDPNNAQKYNENAAIYAQKIRNLQKKLAHALDGIPPSQRYLVTSEGAFSYLAQDMGMREVYIWPVNAEQQGSPLQVRKVIDTVRKHHIPVVFSESTVSDKPAKQVAKETGAHYGGVLYVDSLSAEGGLVPTYLDLLQVTTDTILKGFAEAKTAHDE